jgi:hypothetical protein
MDCGKSMQPGCLERRTSKLVASRPTAIRLAHASVTKLDRDSRNPCAAARAQGSAQHRIRDGPLSPERMLEEQGALVDGLRKKHAARVSGARRYASRMHQLRNLIEIAVTPVQQQERRDQHNMRRSALTGTDAGGARSAC